MSLNNTKLLESYRASPMQKCLEALEDPDLDRDEYVSFQYYRIFLETGRNPNINYELIGKVRTKFTELGKVKLKDLEQKSGIPLQKWQHIKSGHYNIPLSDDDLNAMLMFLMEYNK